MSGPRPTLTSAGAGASVSISISASASASSSMDDLRKEVSRGAEREWEELRKEARKLESEVDVKLAAFSKLGQGIGESAALLGENGTTLVRTKGLELEGLLGRLSDLNDAMSAAVSGAGLARTHTVARHRDILLEFTQEFYRTRSIISAGLEHESLLGGRVAQAPAAHGFLGMEGGGGGAATASLLRERASLHTSNTQMDHLIGSAQATVAALSQQRSLFDGLSGKIHQLGTRFPLLNSILGQVRRKRSRDTLILSAVIAMCTIFICIYWISK